MEGQNISLAGPEEGQKVNLAAPSEAQAMPGMGSMGRAGPTAAPEGGVGVGGDGGAADAALRVATGALKRTTSIIQPGLKKIRVYVENNHYSVALLSTCGGAFLAIVSAISVFAVFGIFTGPFSYLMRFYEVFFGVTICIIDSPADKLPRARQMVMQYVPFLFNNTGRTTFYVFLAGLEGVQDSSIHLLLGLYFLAIGVLVSAAAVPEPAGNSEEGPSNQ